MDPFDALLGPRRGPSTADHLRETVRELRAELDIVAPELARSRQREATLRRERDELDQALAVSNQETHHARAALEDVTCAWTAVRTREDEARSRLVRAGGTDEPPDAAVEDHGEWSSNRCYLGRQLVTFDGDAWVAWHGARPGDQPGRTRRWRPFAEPARPWPRRTATSTDAQLLRLARGPLDRPEAIDSPPKVLDHSHRTLFQTRLWELNHRTMIALDDLTMGQLSTLLAYLSRNRAILIGLDRVYERNLLQVSLLPCPPYAYATTEAWFADLPLVQGLLQRIENAHAADAVRRGDR
ncbi:MAG: hypothetical protein WBD40_18975 [Tepidisphaeraceae bacterium]